ncbi:MAG: metallophosphoesterase [Cyanobacteria bacterium P01_H01_bin.121]
MISRNPRLFARWLYPSLTGSLQLESRQITIANLPQHLEGLRIAHLTDFHDDGLRLSTRLLDEAIAAVNRANPDFVFLTGDYVTDEPDPIVNLTSALSQLHSRYGAFAVLGNHDNRQPHSRSVITQALESIDITVLFNQVVFPLPTEDLAIVGLADYWSGEFQPELPFQQIAPETPRLVLSHNPDTAAILKDWRVDLQVSGHTHGGQIVWPGWGPVPKLLQDFYRATPEPLRPLLFFIPSECTRVLKNWNWASGLHRIKTPFGTNQLYVNRGLGTYLPGRFYCPPEVALLTLTAA